MAKLRESLERVRPKSVLLLETSPEQNQMRLIADFLISERSHKGIYCLLKGGGQQPEPVSGVSLVGPLAQELSAERILTKC